MRKYFRDEGIVFKKTNLLKKDSIVTIFTRSSGKLRIAGHGIKKITSRRLSHLETCNFIKLSYSKRGEFLNLGETELIWGFSKIKKDSHKMNILFILFLILDRILPERQEENEIFKETIIFLRNLNNKEDFNIDNLKIYLKKVLNIMGFITVEKTKSVHFDAVSFTEELINRKINLNYLY